MRKYSNFICFATGESIARMMPNANLALATPAPEENWGPPVINNLIANTFDEGMQTVFRKFSIKMHKMYACVWYAVLFTKIMCPLVSHVR